MIKHIVILLALMAPVPAEALTLQDLRDLSRSMAIDNGVRLRFSTSTIDSFLNEGQRIIITETLAMRRSTEFELTTGATFYDLPDNYMQMWRLTLDYRDLYEITPMALANKGKQWEKFNGRPTHYFIDFASRSKVGVYPWPNTSSDTGTIRYTYIAEAPDFTLSTDEPYAGDSELSSYHYIPALYAAFRMTAIDGRVDLAILYRTEFYEGIKRMKRESQARPSYRPGLRPAGGRTRVGP